MATDVSVIIVNWNTRGLLEKCLSSLFNFAAESHVDRSITAPKVFIETNVTGTLTLLEAAHDKKLQRFIQISTDEVYGSLGPKGKFTEQTPLSPNSPYSASKAAGDYQKYYDAMYKNR